MYRSTHGTAGAATRCAYVFAIAGSLPSFGLRGYRWSTSSRSLAQYQLFAELQDRLPLAISDDGRTVARQGYDANDPAWVLLVPTK